MKQQSLAKRLAIAFGSLIAIIFVVGGIAAASMVYVRGTASDMDHKYVPGALVANNVERSAMMAMYEVRAYGFTDDAKYLTAAKTQLSELKQHLASAKSLAVEQDMAYLAKATDEAISATDKYMALVDETERVVTANHAVETAMAQAGNKAQEQCLHYSESQYQAANQEYQASNIPADKLAERCKKIQLSEGVITSILEIRLAVNKGMANRDFSLFDKATKEQAEALIILGNLRSITRQEVNLKQIADCESAIKSYGESLASFVTVWKRQAALTEERATVGRVVLAQAKAVAMKEMELVEQGAHEAGNMLGLSAWVVAIGLVSGIVVGIATATGMTRSVTRAINTIVENLTSGAEQTSAAAGQVSSSSQQLAEGASEQAASLEETSSSLEEMSSMTMRNTENANKAKTMAVQARESADTGSHDMEQMSKAMEEIKNSSAAISKIIKTIDEIAFQTNILALNAAVEAARAGDAGAGFAVVADEVRSLAQRAAMAARDTAGMIEDAIVKTNRGVDLSTKVGAALGDITSRARQMDKVVQASASNAEETAASSEQLNAQAMTMKEVVGELASVVHGSEVRALETSLSASDSRFSQTTSAGMRKSSSSLNYSKLSLGAGSKK